MSPPLEWDETELARRRAAGGAAIRRRCLTAGWLGATAGAFAFVPGLGILLGLLSWRIVEIPSIQRHQERLCRELVDLCLPHADTEEAERVIGLLADRRDPNRISTVECAAEWMGAAVMTRMRDLESGMLRRAGELLDKILLPFGVGAIVGFVFDYYEMRRLERWAGYRLEVLAGVPSNLVEPYTDFSGWIGCGCGAVLVAALVGIAVAVMMLVNGIRSLSLPFIGCFRELAEQRPQHPC